MLQEPYPTNQHWHRTAIDRTLRQDSYGGDQIRQICWHHTAMTWRWHHTATPSVNPTARILRRRPNHTSMLASYCHPRSTLQQEFYSRDQTKCWHHTATNQRWHRTATT